MLANASSAGSAVKMTTSFKIKEDEVDFYDNETQVYLATETNKHRQFVLKLFGFELYFFGRKNLNHHEFMHTLVGTFISDLEASEVNGVMMYPIKISLPPKYSRVLFFESQRIKEEWKEYLKNAALSMNFEDYYVEGELLGKGSMGDVKMCSRKADNKKYAVKIVAKSKQSRKDMELQKREIEALKMCQHPNLIGFYDFFENNNLYHIVIEYLAGGDLFDYLERRDFKISEHRAKILFIQIA